MILWIIPLAIIAIALGPLALLWSLNTLFGLGIAYTLKTWVAALLLGGTVASSKGRKS